MEFEDEHDEEQEEEEEEEEDITIPPPQQQQQQQQPTPVVPPSYDSAPPSRPRVNPPPPSSGGGERRSVVVRYRECLKNHAVSIGGHAVDGCGEFMPAGEEGTLDALKCAACNCHRNFHRKETDMSGETIMATNQTGIGVGLGGGEKGAAVAGGGGVTPTPSPASTLYPQFSAYYRTPAPPSSGYHHPHLLPHGQYRPLAALPSTSGGTHSGEMGDDMSHPSSSGGEGRRESGSGGGGGGSAMIMVPKKRFRTKFTQEQKDKMLAFAEKLGWRIQKHDEAAVQQFCAEVQVKRQVLKVWMHNNKHTLGKKP